MVDQGGVIVDQMSKCWLRCGSPGCGKLRLVHQSALLSLQSDEFLKGLALDDEWKTWLADAGRRYEVASSVGGEVGGQDGNELVEGVAVSGAEDDVASLVDDGDASSDWSSCCGPEDRVPAGMERVVECLGGRGGFGDGDRAALDRLEKAAGGARVRADGARRQAAFLQRPGVCGERAVVLAFTCDMLQRAVGRGACGSEREAQNERGAEQGAQQSGWVTMSCDDEDDYEALLKQSCASEGLAEGDAVILLRGDEEDGGLWRTIGMFGMGESNGFEGRVLQRQWEQSACGSLSIRGGGRRFKRCMWRQSVGLVRPGAFSDGSEGGCGKEQGTAGGDCSAEARRECNSSCRSS